MKETIRDFQGRILGYLEEKPNKDIIVRDFYGRVKGRYDAAQNVTRDFYGRIVARGNQAAMLINM